ncbi:MAG: sigma-70 family RNA polymerase sigma factor [Planctomycetes bacterium]|nr:sigma-70 family RNA polymerase sigma factor [Planctomycetota bacterium]
MTDPNEPADLAPGDEIKELEAARKGDPEALGSLLGGHLGFIRDRVRRLAPRDGAYRDSDFVQSALLKAIEGLPGFNGSSRGAFVAWLGSIVRNTVLQRQRYRNAAKRAGKTSGSGVDELAAMTHTPSSEAAQLDSLVTVARAMRALTDEQRRAIELRIIDELPYPVVAAELGLGEGAARMAVSRARAALALEISRLEGEDG